MNETCGCCEGIEKITPVTIANRPGLSSLIYRVGTHASFLETMKARLSNLGLTLEDRGVIPDTATGGDQIIYPLRRLTTRAAYDPAIAFLDAWAIVADVLTFYQERIADEGYLRTATERRSILELARLVGYALRPGVSASVFLAYTLEVGAETTIAAGNRAQSLPGPGETPQPFETADKLLARAKWNNLQPRLTRPQFITQDNADVIDKIYFQGASTGLKPNDPLLLIFNENTDPAIKPPGQFVRFVQAVEPQAAESRTKVTLQDIVTVDTLNRAIQQTVARYLDLPTFCVSISDSLTNDVLTVLQALLSGLPPADVKTIVQKLNIALYGDASTGQNGLQVILGEAVNAGDAHIANWLGGLVNDLEQILRRVFVSGADTGIVEGPPSSSLGERARLLVPTLQSARNVLSGFIPVEGPPPSNGSNGFTGIAFRLPDLVVSLSKPASLQPASSQRLDRSVSKAFGTQSDILPQLLATLNPALKPTLYPAVSNAVVTPPSDLQSAQALRVKSAPFGDNAPLRPITNDKGIVVDHTEWPIAGTETIEVDISTGMGGIQTLATPAQATISVTQDGQKLSKQVILDPNKPKMQVPLDGSSVDITIAVARLRFIHALFNHQDPVDVYINGEKMNSSPVAYSAATDYFIVPPADTTLEITVRPAGQPSAPPLLTIEVTVDAGTSSTFIAREDAFVQTTNDDISPPPTGQARIRLVNASSSIVNGASSADGTISLTVPPSPPNNQNSNNQSVKAGTYDLTVSYISIGTETGGTFQTSVTLDDQGIYDVLLLDTSDPVNPLSSALLGHPPLIETNELLRYTFSFPEQSRVFGMIAAGQQPPLSINLIILQVDNFVGRFTQNQTQLISADGRNIILQVGDNSISLTDEGFAPVPVEERKIIALDAKFDQITPGSWVVIERPDRGQTIISRVISVQQVSKADYGITGNVTQLALDQPWLDDKDVSLATLRQVTVYAQSVQRDLAEETIDPVKESVCGDQIELDDVYGGLQSGRWLIVAGERTDILGASGVQGAELVMLAGVKQGVHQVRVPDPGSPGGGKMVDLPGDTTHTLLTLANALSYTYKRDTVTVYGNVVRATHGQTRNEILGSGDGSKELQQFGLRQSPLTYLSAPTPAGAVSTLMVFVNDIEWHEADNLASLGPTEREFITQTDNDDKTTVIFGNGEHGARLPTGVENVKATYRTGIGKPGNVNARQISLLATRPLGVKSVINPLPATGGADRESIDQARRNVPLAVLALDRLVSVQDYADFARTFAGIGKASAARLSDGRRQLVHLTIAGADNIPIDVNSDLYRNLFQSLRQFGDPNEPLLLALADVSLLVIQAKVRLLPDYQLESVESQIRAAMLNAFSFEQRELGQPVFQSEVISVIQGVQGVDYARLEIMGAVSQQEIVDALTKIAKNPPVPPETETDEFLKLLGLTDAEDILLGLAQFAPTKDNPNYIAPAQLAFLSPDVADTLIIGEIPDERQA